MTEPRQTASVRIDREGAYHRAVLHQLQLRLPGAIVHHSPNEFPGKGEAIARAIAKAKKNGMVVGFPDLVVFWQGQVALVEVKAPGGRLSASQVNVRDQFAKNGFKVHVVGDPDDVIAIADSLRRNSESPKSIGDLAQALVERAVAKRPEAAE